MARRTRILNRAQRDTILFLAGIGAFVTLLVVPTLRDPLIMGLTATALGVPLVMKADEVREANGASGRGAD